MTAQISALTKASFKQAVTTLAQQDKDIAHIVTQYGMPDFWTREASFAGLVHIILEQQVSLKSARACYEKLGQLMGKPEAITFLEQSDEQLKDCGFSRQKTRYCRILAQAICDKELNLQAFKKLDNEQVSQQLTQLKGIGPWTADIFLMMGLRRADLFPVGDLALIIAAQEIKQLENRPDAKQLEAIALQWSPYRSVAARILWHYYLHRNARSS